METWDMLLEKFKIDMISFENFRESSIKIYLANLQSFHNKVKKPVEQITEADLQIWKMNLMAKEIKRNTKRLEQCIVNKFFGWYAKKFNVKNISQNLSPIQEEIRDPHIPTVADVARLIAAPGLKTFIARRESAIIALFAGTGIRSSELVLLNWGDVKVISEKEFEVDIPIKKTRSRRVPFGNIKQADILATTFGLYYLELKSQYKIKKTDPLFFSERTGNRQRISKSWCIQVLNRYSKQIDKQISSTTLRHFFGTYMALAGINLRLLQYYMGHALLSTTERYVHLGDKIKSRTTELHPLYRIKRPELTKINELIKRL